MARLIRVVVVDDHPVVAEGLASAIGRQPDMEVSGIAASIEAARTLLEQVTVDVGLLDLRVADRLGFELLGERSAGGPRWIVLSSFDLDEYVRAAFARGAAGYLLKTAPLPDLLAAIRRVAAGGSAYERRHLAVLAAPAVALSERERKIVAGVVAAHNPTIRSGPPSVCRRRRSRPTSRDSTRDSAAAHARSWRGGPSRRAGSTWDVHRGDGGRCEPFTSESRQHVSVWRKPA